MDGEIDLELYTISIIWLNKALEKLENNESIEEIETMFNESFNDLNRLYLDIVHDLNQEEVNLNEYYLFFRNGRKTFPHYIELLESIDNDQLEAVVDSLIILFNNFNKIAEAFTHEEVIR
ncbi:hypothetical protein [Methanobrevibacter sp.]|uniref:hypothetical protein n=1 Tax=Methanobrevibacter sp. TaxID=66852 RepID=UPI00386C87FA